MQYLLQIHSWNEVAPLIWTLWLVLRVRNPTVGTFEWIITCCFSFLARNPFSDQRYLIAVVPKGILLMQWYQPQNAFKMVMVSHHFHNYIQLPLSYWNADVWIRCAVSSELAGGICVWGRGVSYCLLWHQGEVYNCQCLCISHRVSLIKAPKIRQCSIQWILVYSELPLIWTPEMRPPLCSGHFKMSQSMLPSANPPLKWGHPSNQDTLTGPKGVAGLEGVHCTTPVIRLLRLYGLPLFMMF